MKIKLTRHIDGRIEIKADENSIATLKKTILPGCPFDGYTAKDLFFDLLSMYSWKMERKKEYTLLQFLDICNDIHAGYYRYIFE